MGVVFLWFSYVIEGKKVLEKVKILKGYVKVELG